MLTKHKQMNREQLEMIMLEQLVPENYLVRKVEAAIDFSFIYPLVEDNYSAERGRPSIDPVVLIKMTFVQYMFGIRSMRKTIEEMQLTLDIKHLRLHTIFWIRRFNLLFIYAKRKETVERVFADAKEKHGMRWTTLRGFKKLSMQAMLTFAAMNLKKMANWTWESPETA